MRQVQTHSFARLKYSESVRSHEDKLMKPFRNMFKNRSLKWIIDCLVTDRTICSRHKREKHYKKHLLEIIIYDDKKSK